MVRAKKHLGQHFLKDDNIAQKIAHSLKADPTDVVLEIGPGTGMLTQHLILNYPKLIVMDVDEESIEYLRSHYDLSENRLLFQDFLKCDLNTYGEQVHVVGNFPYNISSQILFKVYDNIATVPSVVGMFQKEVAQRIASPPGNKTYGILSVLLQTFYDIEYLFTVSENVFIPPPKVKSGVIRLTRKTELPDVDTRLLKKVVKTAFNQRRKTLRNSLKSLLENGLEHPLLQSRPEQLEFKEFITLTKLVTS